MPTLNIIIAVSHTIDYNLMYFILVLKSIMLKGLSRLYQMLVIAMACTKS